MAVVGFVELWPHLDCRTVANLAYLIRICWH
jgi:hypothetical protein